MSGYQSATWGDIKIEYIDNKDFNEDEDPDLFISSIPIRQPAIIPNILQYYPTKHNYRKDFEIPDEFTCEYLNISKDGLDGYYPRGVYEITNIHQLDDVLDED